jgi:hypothetical protein
MFPGNRGREGKRIRNSDTCPAEPQIFKIEILWGESILKDYHSGDWAVWTYVNGEIIGSEIVTSDELGAEGGSHIVSTKRFVQQGQELEGSLRFSRMVRDPFAVYCR